MGEDVPHGALRPQAEGEGALRLPQVLQLQKRRLAGVWGCDSGNCRAKIMKLNNKSNSNT